MNFKIRLNPLHAAALVAACGFTLSCTKGASVSGDGSSSSIQGSLGVDKVYPTSQGSSWNPIVSDSRYYIKGLGLTVTGTCSRGIATIKVNEGGGNYAEMANCQADGTFTWTKTYQATVEEGNKTLHFTAYDVSGAQITSATAEQDVRVDNTPPNIVTITAPGSLSYNHTGAVGEFRIEGTVTTEVDHITGPGGVVITPSGGNWHYDATFNPGASAPFTFYTWDLAGNPSAGVTQTILWSPAITLFASGVISGGVVADASAAGASMEVSIEPMQGETLDANNKGFGSGFNFFINKVRGL